MVDIACPWCGNIMEPKGAEYESSLKAYIGQMICTTCGASGPVCHAASPYEATDGCVTIALEHMRIDPMTLDEVRLCKEPCVVELHGGRICWGTIVVDEDDGSVFMFTPMHGTDSIRMTEHRYNRGWRIWSRVPSSAERICAMWASD